MSTPEERLYGLMEVAEAQQAAVREALEALATERAALAGEREKLARGAREAVATGLSGAATTGVAAVRAATRPLLDELVLVGWLAGTVVLWWDNGAIAAARATEARLAAEVEQMRATRDAWARAGMVGKLERCGPRARPCVRVDEGAGAFGERGDYRVILGY